MREEANEPEPPPVVQMMILWNPANGEVNVSGPLDQKVVCLGMLAMAQKAVHDYDRNNGIVLARSAI